MPELPEVETVRRGLAPYATGKKIKALELRRGNLRAEIPKDLPERVVGKTVTAIDRHGKTMIWRIEGVPPIAWHLGMSGSFRVETVAEPPRKHDHAVLVMMDGTRIVFNDPRRFGMIGYAKDELAGVDPYNIAFTKPAFRKLLENRKTPIKSALLDQRLVTGIGNIYACEALWMTKIHPLRQTGDVKPKEADNLHDAIIDVLDRAIASGGSSLRDHVTITGELGYFQHHFAVYGKKGQKCERCATPIDVMKIAGRSTFFCPKCQKA